MNGQRSTTTSERVARLETQVSALIEAVEALARGLEDGPLAEPQVGDVQKAARRAHELALLARAGEQQ